MFPCTRIISRVEYRKSGSVNGRARASSREPKAATSGGPARGWWKVRRLANARARRRLLARQPSARRRSTEFAGGARSPACRRLHRLYPRPGFARQSATASMAELASDASVVVPGPLAWALQGSQQSRSRGPWRLLKGAPERSNVGDDNCAIILSPSVATSSLRRVAVALHRPRWPIAVSTAAGTSTAAAASSRIRLPRAGRFIMASLVPRRAVAVDARGPLLPFCTSRAALASVRSVVRVSRRRSRARGSVVGALRFRRGTASAPEVAGALSGVVVTTRFGLIQRDGPGCNTAAVRYRGNVAWAVATSRLLSLHLGVGIPVFFAECLPDARPRSASSALLQRGV